MKKIFRAFLMIAAVIGTISFSGIARADDSLFQALGGKEGLTQIIADFKASYLNDERIKDQFDNINLDRLSERFYFQFCELTGGPCHYPGRDMYHSHKGLALNQAQFNAVVEDLQFALDKNKIPFRTQNKFIALLAPMERDIVTR